jgi:hypothetical protein
MTQRWILRPLIAASLILGLIACGEEETPKPAAVDPALQGPTARPATPPPAAEAPKPDPNKELARLVKEVLETEKFQGSAIGVTAADGVVTLWGTAQTAAERNAAVSAARKVSGVKSVQNNLVVVAGS